MLFFVLVEPISMPPLAYIAEWRMVTVFSSWSISHHCKARTSPRRRPSDTASSTGRCILCPSQALLRACTCAGDKVSASYLETVGASTRSAGLRSVNCCLLRQTGPFLHRGYYGLWKQQGYLQTTEDNVVYYGFFERFIEELGTHYNIREIAFVRWGAIQMVQNLKGLGFTVVPFGQGFKDMPPPTKELMKLTLWQ